MVPTESTLTQPQAPSVLEELDKALRVLEENIFALHGRLDLVSMRDIKNEIVQAANPIDSSLHITSLVTRVHLANEVLGKMLNELQV